MNNVNELVKLYHTGYIVLLVLAGIFFAAAVAMFFKFNIRRIWMIRSGRAVRKSIKEMEELSAQSGKFRAGKTYNPREKSAPLNQPPTAPFPEPEVEELQNVVIKTPSEEMRDGGTFTSILKKNDPVDIGTFVIQKTIMLVHTEEVI